MMLGNYPWSRSDAVANAGRENVQGASQAHVEKVFRSLTISDGASRIVHVVRLEEASPKS